VELKTMKSRSLLLFAGSLLLAFSCSGPTAEDAPPAGPTAEPPPRGKAAENGKRPEPPPRGKAGKAGKMGKSPPGDEALSASPGVVTSPSASAIVKRAQSGGDYFFPENPLGINTGVGLLHKKAMENFDMSQWPARAQSDMELLAGIGTRWYRAHNAAYPGFDQYTIERDTYNLAHHDLVIRMAQEAQTDVMIVLGRTRGVAECRAYKEELPATLVPTGAEKAKFEAYVKRIVERYDGDGVDDMPGLIRPVRWYQIGNEHDLHNASCEQEGVEYATPQQVLDLHRIAHAALKEADENARVVLSIAYGYEMEQATGWGKSLMTLNNREILKYLDAVDLHEYSFRFDRQKERIESMKALSGGLPVWMTETSVPGDDSVIKGWNESRQARDGALMIMQALELGVQRLFWHTLKDGPNQGKNPFSSNGMYRCDSWSRPAGPAPMECGSWSVKPVGRMYRILSQALDGYQSATPLSGEKGWRIKRVGRPDALVLRPGSGSFNAGQELGSTALYVWDLVETGGDDPVQSSGVVTLGEDPLLVSADQ
jgi:hypothetical protein